MKKNILFALAVILLAGVIAVTRVMTRTEGATARVEITDAETITLPLDKDGTYEISEGKLPVTLEVSEGRIRFINSRHFFHICQQALRSGPPFSLYSSKTSPETNELEKNVKITCIYTQSFTYEIINFCKYC